MHNRRTQTEIAGYRKWPLLCTRICPYPFFEATPPGAAPGPPVKTGARVRRFRGCKLDRRPTRTPAMGVLITLVRGAHCRFFVHSRTPFA